MGRIGNTFFFAVFVFSLGSASLILAAFHTRPISYTDAYAVLTLPVDIDDEAVVQTLEIEGIEGTVSESTQWLMMDNFGELERIKLSEYNERVADFDPRNDGYADKLRSFFISGSVRRLYLPKLPLLLDVNDFTQKVTRAVSRLDSPVLDASGFKFDLGTQTYISYFTVYTILAGFITLVVVALYTRSFIRCLLMVPAVLSLSAFGPAGLVVAGFLFAMTGPLKDGILEFLGPPARIAGSSKGSGKPLDPFFLSAYKNRFPITSLSISFSRHPVSFAPLVSMAALVIVSASGILPWLVTIISFVCSIVFMLIEALVESSKALESGHRPFIPLMIIPSRRMFPLGTSRTIAPFVMASLICLISEVFLLLAFPSFGRPAGALVEGPSMNDYEEHLVFQRSFSLRRLGGNGVDSAYLNYELSEIGLVIQSDGKVGLDGIPKPNPYPSELPPVERIMKRVNHHPSTDSPFSAIGGFLSYPSILVVVLSVIVTAPMFLGKGSKKRRSKNASFLAAKRMAA